MTSTSYSLARVARVAAPSSFVTVSPSSQRELAAAYRALPMLDRDALPTWRAMREETMRQLDALTDAGIDVVADDADPYVTDDGTPDAAAMMDDLRINGRIRVLSTRVTGSHPVWSDDDNDAFRAVHDVYGHAATGRGFDRHGEEARGAILARKGGHHAIASCYVRAAAALNRSGELAGIGAPITPAEVQAVTWIVWRTRHGHARARAAARSDLTSVGA